MFLEYVVNNYKDYLHIYTDGSKTQHCTSAAFYLDRFDIKHVIKINNNCSIFSAELYAILKSLYWLSSKRIGKTLILTDNLCSLQVVFNNLSYGKNLLVNKIIMLYSILVKSGLEITFLWIPSHSGIHGNEIADQLAKLATTSNLSNSIFANTATKQANLQISTSEIKTVIKNHVYVLWDKFYNQSNTGLFYKSFFPSVFSISTSSSPILFRLRTGHCKLNSHLHKIGLHSSGLCSSCFVPEDIEHVLLHCPRYSIPRNLFCYHLQTIKVDFTLRSILLDVSESHLLSFIVSAQLFI